MNTQIQEALKMAIAELEKGEGWMDNVSETIQFCKEALAQSDKNTMNKTQKALKLAIEQMQHLIKIYIPSPEWSGTAIQEDCYEALQACEEALAQPQPKLFLDLSNSNGNHPVQQEPVEKYMQPIKPLVTTPSITISNATSPPAPSWQGLSDDEIQSILDNSVYCEVDAEPFARAIEQALKEKNT